MARVFFVRHGHPSPAVSREQPDPELSRLGIRQAHEAAVRLGANVENPKLLCSPARRSYQTAKIIGVHLGVSVSLESDLAEFRGAGAADKASRDQISLRWLLGDGAAGHPNGETLGEGLDRFSAVLRRLTKVSSDDDLVLVSHGAFIAMGLLHLCDHELDLSRVASLVHCAIPELEIYPLAAPKLGRLRAWNPSSVYDHQSAPQPGPPPPDVAG